MLRQRPSIAIIGGGITGLTLALSLNEQDIGCRVFEAATAFRPLGVGINLLPHAMRELSQLGLEPALGARAVATREMAYYNRFGQFIYAEPRGRFAGYPWPQFSVHRADLHEVLVDAVRARLGDDAIAFGHRFAGAEQDEAGATAQFVDDAGAPLESVRADAVIGCDGVHSVLRRQLYPDEGPPVYKGINMWRGVTRRKPYLGGATMVQAGWLDVGKIVVYPISPHLDEHGRQLINWVAEFRSPRNVQQDWTLAGRLEDVLPRYADWHFPWLDVPAMLRDADIVLEYPMVDRDPLPAWTRGRVTLAGDAAHPMYPRGGNGAGQGILDARALARCCAAADDLPAALKAYEAERMNAANQVVLANRSRPPDYILQVVHERSGDRPFERLEDLVSVEELAAITDGYKRVAGFDKETLRAKQ
jgi:2-polyprenyl-6-methoxyphenol hydroxylase-like FAD-dependent oxidoreductase